jgi:hypothetical protein
MNGFRWFMPAMETHGPTLYRNHKEKKGSVQLLFFISIAAPMIQEI